MNEEGQTQNKDAEEQQKQPTKKVKYFSKKHKHHEMPKHKEENPDKTVEVYLFESNKEAKSRLDVAVGNRSPLNKSVEAL